jgi:hypothetical protein
MWDHNTEMKWSNNLKQEREHEAMTRYGRAQKNIWPHEKNQNSTDNLQFQLQHFQNSAMPATDFQLQYLN